MLLVTDNNVRVLLSNVCALLISVVFFSYNLMCPAMLAIALCIAPNFQVDSNSFFLDHSYGANSEVAGIVTLLAVVDQLGRLKRSDTVRHSACVYIILYMCMNSLNQQCYKKSVI